LRKELSLIERKVARTMDYKRTFSSEQGRRVLHDLIAAHNVMTPTYVKGDAIDMAYREGGRNAVLRILTILETNEEAMQKLIRESNNGSTTG
jgi:hypothetical protein